MKTESMAWAIPERLKFELENHPKYARYLAWKSKYPRVIGMFADITFECLEKKKHFGMWLVANELRWRYWWKYDTETEFKISNDYTALITREIMLLDPNVKTFCRIKKLSWANGMELLS